MRRERVCGAPHLLWWLIVSPSSPCCASSLIVLDFPRSLLLLSSFSLVLSSFTPLSASFPSSYHPLLLLLSLHRFPPVLSPMHRYRLLYCRSLVVAHALGPTSLALCYCPLSSLRFSLVFYHVLCPTSLLFSPSSSPSSPFPPLHLILLLLLSFFSLSSSLRFPLYTLVGCVWTSPPPPRSSDIAEKKRTVQPHYASLFNSAASSCASSALPPPISPPLPSSPLSDGPTPTP